jgi:uncharacterized membrane protein
VTSAPVGRGPRAEGRRLQIEAWGLCAFIVTVAALSGFAKPIDAFLISFAAYAALYCAYIARRLGQAPLSDLPARCAKHDASAAAVLALGVVLVFMAMTIVSMALAGGVKTHSGAALVALTVLASWTLLHFVFAIHYTHAFFADTDAASAELVFPGGGPSHFSDFLYFSFIIGMTFQVSDVVVAGPKMRRLVLAHSMLAFFLNVFVLSLTITAVGGML